MRFFVCIVVILLGFSATALFAESQEINFIEQPGVLEFSGRMIVRPLQEGALKAQGMEAAQAAAVREAAATRLDAWRVKYQSMTDEHIISIPEGLDENTLARQLMATGEYQYVEPDWVCYPIDTIPNDPEYSSQWHHPKMNCPKAWDLYTGDSTRIAAFVDTGVDTDHPDLQGHLVPGFNSVDLLPQSQGGDVEDIVGHGTAVAGCISAIGNNGVGVTGVNWGIKLMPVRATNLPSGGAFLTDLLNGALWASQSGAKTVSVSYSGVINASVGTTGTLIKGFGALLIWAAGNDGIPIYGYDWSDVIIVGATDQNDDPAYFTNYGTLIDVMAPGVSVHTTEQGGGYAAVDGTSFSTPLTNGVAALIWGYNPALTPNEVEQALFEGCEDMGNQTNFGHGRLDAFWSLKLANPELIIELPEGLPEGSLPPGPETVFQVKIDSGTQNYVPGTGTLHYRFDPGEPYSTTDITPLPVGDLHVAVLPNTKPGDEPEYYFSFMGDGGTTVFSPPQAQDDVYSFEVRFLDPVFEDDFESDLGWKVYNYTLQSGAWERADPLGTGAQPEDDHSADGTMCYVTGQLGGAMGFDDVDGGPTRLISPAFDLSTGDAEISFYLWFYHSNTGQFQPLSIEISNNHGFTYTTVADLHHNPGWNFYSITVSDYVTPTDGVAIRFCAEDNPNGDIVEGLLDDFKVQMITDDPSLWADTYSISVAQQTEVGFNLDAGAVNANRSYWLLGSVTGTAPGFNLPGGHTVPLNWDLFTELILTNLGSPLFQNFQGTLNGSGEGNATFDTLGPLDPGFVGVTAYFAFVLGPPTAWDFSSNPIPVTLVP